MRKASCLKVNLIHSGAVAFPKVTPNVIRRIDGVLDARQYTVPKEQYLEAIRNGETPDVDGYKGHLRECYVVAAPDADKAKIENEIKTMENYFVGYETVVNFISQEGT